MVDVASTTLVAALDAAGLSEYTAPLQAQLEPLLRATAAGQKPLLDFLKDTAGVSKMGHRQKLAKVLRDQLESASAEPPEPPAASCAAAEPPAASGFWASLAAESEESTSAGVDLSAPVALDASLYAQPPQLAVPRTQLVGADEPRRRQRASSPPPEGGPVSLDKRPASYDGEGAGRSQQLSEQLLAYRERGNAAYGRQDYTAAEKWYGKAAEIEVEHEDGMHPDRAAAISNLAACALARTPADPNLALRRLRPLLSALPRHTKARLRAGRCCVMLGELQAAIAHYEAALRSERDAMAPSTKPFELRYAPPKADAGERLTLMGPDGKTRLTAEAQQAQDGRSLAARMLSHAERCRSLSAAGRVDEALYLGRAVARHVTHASTGQMLVVSVLESRGRLWEAQQEAEVASAAFPAEEELGVALARLYAKRGKVDEAEEQLRAVARAAGGEGSRASRAVRGMRDALELKRRGNAAYAEREYERAAAAYTEAIELDVEGCVRPTLLANRAQARLSGGRAAEAARDVDDALRLDAGNVKLLLRRAACHVALNQPSRAFDDYAAVLTLEPDNPTAREYVDAHEAEHGKGRARDGDAGGADDGGVPAQLDPYAMLGVPRDADAAAIKAAYRKLALRWHPDKWADGTEEERMTAEEEFRWINAANAVLTDPVKRRTYDLGGSVADLVGRHAAPRPS